MYLVTDLMDIFFVKERARLKVCNPVDTSHSLPLTQKYSLLLTQKHSLPLIWEQSLPLTWALWVARKLG